MNKRIIRLGLDEFTETITQRLCALLYNLHFKLRVEGRLETELYLN